MSPPRLLSGLEIRTLIGYKRKKEKILALYFT
jgi:hypothetical protein